MSQTNPTINELEVLAKSSVMGMSHVDGFKLAYPKSKAKGNSLRVAAYKAYQNTNIPLTIERIREQTRELASKDTIADLTECQESWTDVIRTGRQKKDDGSMVDAPGVRAAAAELCKQRGDYTHDEFEDDIVIISRNVPGRGV